MAIWNAPRERRNAVRSTPRTLVELAARLESDPAAAWDWIERLQSAHRIADRAASPARGVVPTPPEIALRMAAALVQDTPRGTAIRVLDPGCGRGRLLTAVARAAAARGIHVDCEGVEIDAATARWAQALEPLVRTAARDVVGSWHVRRADFLLSPSPRGDCDAVIANPPYVPLRSLDRAARERLRGRTAAGGAGDLAALFLARLLDRLRPGGRLVVIVPNKLLAAHYATALRRRLCGETCIEEIWDLSDVRIFAGRASYPVVIVARRIAAPLRHAIRIRDAAGAERGAWPQSVCATLPDAVFPVGMDPRLIPVLERLQALPRLGDRAPLRCGIATTGFGRAIGDGDARILCAGDVRPLRTGPGRRFSIQQAGVSAATCARLRVPKVVLPGMFRRLCAAWEPGSALLGRVYYIPVRDPADGTGPHRALLLGLLNSRLYAVLYAGWFAGVAQSGGWLRLNAPYVAAMPWPLEDPGSELERIVARLERAPDGAAWNALDGAVEELFGCSAAERRILERVAKKLPPRVTIPHAWGRTPAGRAPAPRGSGLGTDCHRVGSDDRSEPESVGMDVA